ncbi:MAG: MerR family DNA-binding protein [Pseudobdellovibrionaceae bacterium]|nr:MAG: MerR family DNA-binding protein [Pseudobdellovibrionaceae bacterium]
MSIRWLRTLGFSLDEIKGLLKVFARKKKPTEKMTNTIQGKRLKLNIGSRPTKNPSPSTKNCKKSVDLINNQFFIQNASI